MSRSGAVTFKGTPLTLAGEAVKVGQPAPDFTLQASDGQTYELARLRGKTVVFAWFPKAFTSA